MIAAEGQGKLGDGKLARAMEWLSRSLESAGRLAIDPSLQRFEGARRR